MSETVTVTLNQRDSEGVVVDTDFQEVPVHGVSDIIDAAAQVIIELEETSVDLRGTSFGRAIAELAEALTTYDVID